MLVAALVFGAAVLAGAAGSVVACLPGIHAYSVMGACLLLGPEALAALPPPALAAAAIGLVAGFSILNSVPAILLAAPDDSALFTVLPGQKYLLRGRGLHAVLIAAAGSASGIGLLLLVFGPLAPRVLPAVWTVLRPHAHWMLWCVIAFLLLSEWPRRVGAGLTAPRRLAQAWRSLAAGGLTFLLSGLLGFLLFYRSPVAPQAAVQNLMPAFVGLFTLPWLALNAFSGVRLPPQRPAERAGLAAAPWAAGTLAGALGGGFAALLPAVTGAVGGFLAGHAVAQRDDRAFLVAQGAGKSIYYLGGLLLLFVPGLQLTRGGAAALLRAWQVPRGGEDYALALAATALASATALLLVHPLARLTLRGCARWGYRRLSVAALSAAVGLVALLTGRGGLAVLLPAAGIGLLPPLFGARRMNTLGVILLPVACNLSGCGPAVAAWLRLL